jgi:hypothetical protein
MSSPNHYTKKFNQQPYLAKQLLPQSLLEELEYETDCYTEIKTNNSFKPLQQNFNNFTLQDKQINHPKRKVYSHQNVTSYLNPSPYPFMNPNMMHQGMLNNFQRPMPMCYNNLKADPFMDHPYYDNRMFPGFGIPSTDSKKF